jgi:hypothetical protein
MFSVVCLFPSAEICIHVESPRLTVRHYMYPKGGIELEWLRNALLELFFGNMFKFSNSPKVVVAEFKFALGPRGGRVLGWFGGEEWRLKKKH